MTVRNEINGKRGTVTNETAYARYVEYDDGSSEWVETRWTTRVATRTVQGLHEDVQDEGFATYRGIY